VTNAIASVTEEDLLLCKYDWSVENKTGAALRNNIAEALKLSHSRYSKLKRLNNTQQEEKDITELGMLSIMQMHYNETKTSEAKNWKHTFNDISVLYHEELKSNKLIDSVMIDTSQKQYNAPASTEANDDIGKDDVFDDSDDDDETSSHTSSHTKRFSFFDDEEDEDDPDTQNPLDKKSSHKKNAEIDSHDTAATDKETNDSRKAKNKEVDNIEQREDDEEETGGTATGNKKSDQESATTNKSDAGGNKKRTTDHKLKGKKTTKRKR
jgi:hypothetical protein